MDYNTSTNSFETEIAHWSNIARNNYFWKKEFSHKVRFNHDIRNGDVYQRWFEDGVTNMCYNCLDRHLSSNADRIAYYWEGNELDVARKMTYKELHEEVCKLTGILRSVFKVKKGMCVVVYLPMILLAPVVLLTCARLGVVINVVFGGFSAQELSRRMIDSKAELIITVNGSYRGKKFIPFKQYVDEALEICDSQSLNIKCLVYNHVNSESVNMKEGRDYYASLIDVKPDDYIEWVRSEEPLFILYTSGSTGKPKGLVHVTGGYMVQAGYSFVNVFNYNHATDIFFCTADIGWITGHTYVIFGPLLNCATSVIYEGIPTYPTPARWWQIIDTYKVSTFYTAPTAIRTLMKEGTDWLVSTSRDSLHTVASVGEPLNPSAWEWYHEMVGKSKCRILDTWFQTETGTIIITASTRNEQKPGISGRSIAGISVNMLDTNGREIVGSGEGFLVIRSPFPSQARTILGDHIQYVNTYFTRFPGYYNTADGCNRDCDGCYKITGRVDEVINVSGHRLGTGEIEGAVNSTPGVVESAVVPFSHCIKGEGIAVFVVRQNERISESDIKQQMRVSIGGLAVPDQLFFVPDLPKTRSGKILRHLLRKIYNENSNEVDCTTLANPDAVKSIQQELRNSRME